MKTIIYLYREINPYNIPIFKELVKQGFRVLIVHETIHKLIPYQVPDIDNVYFFAQNNFSQSQLNDFVLENQPLLMYISDRTVRMYNKTAIKVRRKLKIPVISGCDTQWYGGKQWFNVFTSWFRHKRFFSHMIVAGMRQFEYAKKLGFRNDKILWPMNSADIEKFHKCNISLEKFNKPRNFLYVGRFAKVKGLEILIEAWSQIQNKQGATLTLVGNGPLQSKLKYPSGVIIHNYMSQEELIQFASKSSCFILPSIYEPWALVIHEFTAAGLPFIVTSACGAVPHLVINHYNGFVVTQKNVLELKLHIEKIIGMPNEKLKDFALRSREISFSITPKMVAYAITSVLE